METLVELFLEQPKRLEKLIINSLRFLITGWTLALFVKWLIPEAGIIYMKAITDINDLSEVPAYDITLYFVLFILVWLILWSIIARALIPLLIKIIGIIIQWIFFLIIQLFIYIFLKIKWILTSKDERGPSPRFFNFKKNKDEEEDSYSTYFKKKNKPVNNLLDGLGMIRQLLNTSIVYEAILASLSFESNWINSRIRQYYAIILFVFVGFFFKYGIEGFEIYYYILGGIFIVLGVIVVIIDSIFRLIDNLNQHNIRDFLEIQVYKGLIFEAIKNHNIVLNYNIKQSKRKFNLELKPVPDYKYFWDTHEIEIFPISVYPLDDAIINNINRIQNNQYARKIIISNEEPSLGVLNILINNGIFFIYAKNQEDVMRGLDKIRPALSLTNAERIAAEYGFFPNY